MHHLIIILYESANEAGITWKSAANTADVNYETKKSLPATSIASALWTVFGKSGHLRIITKPNKNDNDSKSSKLPPAYRYDGFPPSDYDTLASTFQSLYNIPLKPHTISTSGTSWGNTNLTNQHLVFRQCILEDADEEGEEFEPRDGHELLSMDLGEVSQCVLPGNNRNEIEMQFLESDTVEAGTDQLVAIRFYVPPDVDADPTDKEAATPAEELQRSIMSVASVKKTSGSIIAEFDESKGTFLTPRGRYGIELYDSFLRMRGAKYDYKIRYDDISRLFLLPKLDDVYKAFVIALDKPIRQGQQVSSRIGVLLVFTWLRLGRVRHGVLSRRIMFFCVFLGGLTALLIILSISLKLSQIFNSVTAIQHFGNAVHQ